MGGISPEEANLFDIYNVVREYLEMRGVGLGHGPKSNQRTLTMCLGFMRGDGVIEDLREVELLDQNTARGVARLTLIEWVTLLDELRKRSHAAAQSTGGGGTHHL